MKHKVIVGILTAFLSMSLGSISNAAKKAKEVTAKGSVVCAHCDLSLKSSCQKAIKSTDGKVFLLDGKVAKQFFKNKENKKVKTVTAVGTTKEVDGNVVLTASKIDKS